MNDQSTFSWTEVLAQNLRTYSQNPFLQGKVAIWITGDFSNRYVVDTTNYPHKFITTFMPLPTPDVHSIGIGAQGIVHS